MAAARNGGFCSPRRILQHERSTPESLRTNRLHKDLLERWRQPFRLDPQQFLCITQGRSINANETTERYMAQNASFANLTKLENLIGLIWRE